MRAFPSGTTALVVGIWLVLPSVIAKFGSGDALWTDWCGGDEGDLEQPYICQHGAIKEFRIMLRRDESKQLVSRDFQLAHLAARCEDGEELGTTQATDENRFSVSSSYGFESVETYMRTDAETTYISDIFDHGSHDGHDKPCSNGCPSQHVISGFQINKGTVIRSIKFHCTPTEKRVLSGMKPIATPRLLLAGPCYDTAQEAQDACCRFGCIFNSTVSNGVGTYFCNSVEGPIGNCGSDTSSAHGLGNVPRLLPLSVITTILLTVGSKATL